MDNIMDQVADLIVKLTGYDPTADDDEKALDNLLSTVCQNQYSREQVIKYCDNSILGNGSSGMVLTREAICVKDWSNQTSQFIARFEDIESCEMVYDRFWGLDISYVRINMKSGEVFRLSIAFEGDELEEMMEIIETAVDLYKNEGGEKEKSSVSE